jgi:hypothetical protein
MSDSVRVPADVEREDRIIANLTARQVGLLALVGLVLYAAWSATRALLPLPVFLILAIPVAVGASLVVLGRRDGVSLDRLLLAALRHRMTPARQVANPPDAAPTPAWLAAHDSGRLGALRLPVRGVSPEGVIDMGSEGLARIAAASTVDFSLRTPSEQAGMVAAFGRYLHSLAAPTHLLVRTRRLDLTGQISTLRDAAGGLPHPALEAAAREHADYLAQLVDSTDLLRRQVLLIVREPLGAAPDEAARRAAEARLGRRLHEATDLLAAASVVVTPLDAIQTTAVLATTDPETLVPSANTLAASDEIITTAAEVHP